MRLLFDVGNTRIKWAFADGDDVLHNTGALAHTGITLDDGLRALADTAAETRAIWIADVRGGDAGAALARWATRVTGRAPEQAVSERQFGALHNGYRKFQTLGVDRWLAMIGAWHGQPLVVVDAGSALTVDVVDANGQHLGGLIFPGRMLLAQSLRAGTRAVQVIPRANHAGEALGRSTAAGVEIAIDRAAPALINATLDMLAPGFGDGFDRLITGGDGERLSAHLGPAWRSDPQLVLRGLARRSRAV
jgi:type III pantothenate kinase